MLENSALNPTTYERFFQAATKKVEAPGAAPQKMGGVGGCTALLVALVPLTVIEMVLIHADLSEPQTCVNVLDLNTQLGECEKLLSVGEFSCEHDFCPKCTKDGGEGYQAHQCDKACGFCPEVVMCPEDAEPSPACENRLDQEMHNERHCDMLIAEGAFSCAGDFCHECEGVEHAHAGDGTGGHQEGLCDRSCQICTVPSPPTPCTMSGQTEVQLVNQVYADAGQQLPPGAIWVTPAAAEYLASSLVLVVNSLGALAILMKTKLEGGAGESFHEPPTMRLDGSDGSMLLATAVAILLGAAAVISFGSASDPAQATANGQGYGGDRWLLASALVSAGVLFWSYRF